jgi:hypothetical protein
MNALDWTSVQRQLDISAYLFIVSRGRERASACPQGILEAWRGQTMVVVRSGITGFGRGVRRCRNRTCLTRSRSLNAGAVGTRSSAAVKDLRTSRPHNTLGQLTGVSYCGLQRTPDRPDTLSRA